MRVDISAEYRRGMWNIAIKNIASNLGLGEICELGTDVEKKSP